MAIPCYSHARHGQSRSHSRPRVACWTRMWRAVDTERRRNQISRRNRISHFSLSASRRRSHLISPTTG